MRLFLLLFAIGILSYACGGGSDSTSTTSSTSTTETPKKTSKGSKLYKQFCVACHGSDGKMAIAGAKDLSESTLSLEERIEIITNGKTSDAGVMAPHKGLMSEEGIKQVAEYIETLRK